MENYNDHKKYYSSYDYYKIGAAPEVVYYVRSGHYFLDDKHHRTDGPAIIFYFENGDIESEHYYLNGKKIYVSSLEEFKKIIKTLVLK